jgi:hypothetical protein
LATVTPFVSGIVDERRRRGVRKDASADHGPNKPAAFSATDAPGVLGVVEQGLRGTHVVAVLSDDTSTLVVPFGLQDLELVLKRRRVPDVNVASEAFNVGGRLASRASFTGSLGVGAVTFSVEVVVPGVGSAGVLETLGTG